MSSRPRYVRGASAYQKGKAAEYRNDAEAYDIDWDTKQQLHEIVHSGDKTGHWATTPNRFRDHSNSYDQKAKVVLDNVKASKRK